MGVAAVLSIAGVSSQVRMGGLEPPYKTAVLDLNVSNTTNNAPWGLALPRVALVDMNTPLLPAAGHFHGLLVYNTATNTAVTPGLYYNTGTRWVRIGPDTVSLASGTENGTIQLTVNAAVTDNIKVKDLNSAAYKDATAFLASPEASASGKALLGPATQGGLPAAKGITPVLSLTDDLITSGGVYGNTVSDLIPGPENGRFSVIRGATPTSFTVPGFELSPPHQVLATAAASGGASTPSLRQLALADIPGGLGAANIAEGAIHAIHLADEVPTAKLADGAVTGDKIANSSIGPDQLVDRAVTTDKIADSSVTPVKFSFSVLPVSKGGTNASSVTPNGVIYASSTDQMASVAVTTPGQAVLTATSTAPTWKTILPLPSNPQAGQILQYTSNGWVTVEVPNPVVHKNPSSCGTVTDIDGNTYYTNDFGSAGKWMTENLKATHYEQSGHTQGTAIPLRTGTIGATDPVYSYPNNDSTLVSLGGLLYSWATIGSSSSEDQGQVVTNAADHLGWEEKQEAIYQGPCPLGWHVPSDYEWLLLEQHILEHPNSIALDDSLSISGTGGTNNLLIILRDFSQTGRNFRHASVMRSQDFVVTEGMPGATGKSAANGGFAALLVGGLDKDGGNTTSDPVSGAVEAGKYGRYAYFWTSSAYNSGDAYSRHMRQNSPWLARYNFSKANQYSIRCKEN
ncbi:hypothetical protein EZS27_016858 [termite gut metagenome]|uniref:Fibrobacter succinogenes major paralogous domain-containing protein n=1 Tax=termite gut metagenome TaxID=433724 RepID=A0A5J4RMI2_9ZZZZ